MSFSLKGLLSIEKENTSGDSYHRRRRHIAICFPVVRGKSLMPNLTHHDALKHTYLLNVAILECLSKGQT